MGGGLGGALIPGKVLIGHTSASRWMRFWVYRTHPSMNSIFWSLQTENGVRKTNGFNIFQLRYQKNLTTCMGCGGVGWGAWGGVRWSINVFGPNSFQVGCE